MGSPLEPSLANFGLNMNKISQIAALLNIDHHFIDGILMIYLYFSNHLVTFQSYLSYFKSSGQRFQSYLNSCHVNMTFTVENEQNNKILFLDVNIIHEQGKYIRSVYRNPTFSGVYTYFDSFLPDVYKIGMIYTLVNSCFRIYSIW